ncbi:unnamed protein product [Allacma fusca]|uniref:Uncharacterized protein n=1 Tax=Allacma fusca TaxID=39272 RepID=A0A8J2NIV7_9HEXA|nr:unnamed protein product [Allacma fusca]
MSSAGECAGYYGDGSIAGAVIGTFFATLILVAIVYFLFQRRRKQSLKNSGLSNLVVVEDGDDRHPSIYNYDNAGFSEDSDAKMFSKGHTFDGGLAIEREKRSEEFLASFFLLG